MTFQHDVSDMAINHTIIEDHETQQIFLVVGRIVMSSCESFHEALWGLILFLTFFTPSFFMLH